MQKDEVLITPAQLPEAGERTTQLIVKWCPTKTNRRAQNVAMETNCSHAMDHVANQSALPATPHGTVDHVMASAVTNVLDRERQRVSAANPCRIMEAHVIIVGMCVGHMNIQTRWRHAGNVKTLTTAKTVRMMEESKFLLAVRDAISAKPYFSVTIALDSFANTHVAKSNAMDARTVKK